MKKIEAATLQFFSSAEHRIITGTNLELNNYPGTLQHKSQHPFIPECYLQPVTASS